MNVHQAGKQQVIVTCSLKIVSPVKGRGGGGKRFITCPLRLPCCKKVYLNCAVILKENFPFLLRLLNASLQVVNKTFLQFSEGVVYIFYYVLPHLR